MVRSAREVRVPLGPQEHSFCAGKGVILDPLQRRLSLSISSETCSKRSHCGALWEFRRHFPLVLVIGASNQGGTRPHLASKRPSAPPFQHPPEVPIAQYFFRNVLKKESFWSMSTSFAGLRNFSTDATVVPICSRPPGSTSFGSHSGCQ